MKKTLEVGDYVFVNKEQATDETSGTSKPITIDKIKYQIVLSSNSDEIYMATSFFEDRFTSTGLP